MAKAIKLCDFTKFVSSQTCLGFTNMESKMDLFIYASLNIFKEYLVSTLYNF